MNDQLLFLVGVVGDYDDRPRQHRPAPVRCLEAELSPDLIAYRQVCVDCVRAKVTPPEVRCRVCAKDYERDKRACDRYNVVKQERRVWANIERLGYCVAGNNIGAIQRMIDAGELRWMTKRERREARLERFENVAVPANRG